MQCFEIVAANVIERDKDGRVLDQRISVLLPDDAMEIVDPVLEPYDQDSFWYFDKLGSGRPPMPWAYVCLDQEYSIAGHVAKSRPSADEIRFASYRQEPDDKPDDFVPGVGVLVIYSKTGLQRAACESPLFAAAWTALEDCSELTHWVAVLDPLPGAWLESVLSQDREQWLAHAGSIPGTMMML